MASAQRPTWATAIAVVALCAFLLLPTVFAFAVDLSSTTHRNHVFLFGEYDGSGGSTAAAGGKAPHELSPTTRYVQLSNGSRFVCDTTAFSHHDPPYVSNYPLSYMMQTIIESLQKSDKPCTHAVADSVSNILCWNHEVRRDLVSTRESHLLGKRREGAAPYYWNNTDSFGPYAATTFGDGETCLYTKQPTQTEIRFYCRYTELENPIPFLTLYEAAPCRYVMRVMSSKFCMIPQLDHSIATETIRCRMLA